MTRLGEMLRLYRAAHGQSLRECAREIGINHTALHRIETTGRGVTLETFAKMLDWMLAPSGSGDEGAKMRAGGSR